MDPVSIGAAVVTILTPYVADAGKEFLKAAGETGVQKTKELMQWLKGKFANDPVATSDLTRFEKNPKGNAENLQNTIAKKATEDPAFSSELSKRVEDLRPIVAIAQKFTDADTVTGIAGDVRSGNVSITQEGDKVKNLTGINGNVGR